MLHINPQTGLKLSKVIAKAIRNKPHLSLVFVVMGLMVIALGNYRGEKYGPISEQALINMVVTKKYNNNGRSIFPDYRAQGVANKIDGIIDVDIYKKEFENLKIGDKLEIYIIYNQPKAYMYAGAIQSAKPIFKIANFWFTFEAIIGVLLIMFTPYLYYDSYKHRANKI